MPGRARLDSMFRRPAARAGEEGQRSMTDIL